MQKELNFPVYWKTQQGKNILITDLDDNHLQNILLMIRKVHNLDFMAVYADRERNLEQLEMILLYGTYSVDLLKKEMYEWLKSKADYHPDLEDLENEGYNPYF
tara:strand:+ start:1169 stop:1477 length:309 start_codon:yes stop_codon:yes gene_type:complete